MARTPGGGEFENLNDSQLRELIQSARAVLSERVQSKLDEYKALALEAGFEVSFHKIGDGAEKRKRRSAPSEGEERRGRVQAKYRNPDDFSQVWSGRGIQPKWVKQKIAAGAKLSDLEIKPQAAAHAAADEEAASP